VRLCASLLVLCLPLAIYVLTLAHEITFTDSGELAAVAATLGIAHPPGYPLFTLLGRLFALLPVGTVAFRVGLVSAGATALAALLIYRTGVVLLRELVGGRPRRSKRSHGSRRAIHLEIAPLAGGLLFAFAGTVWSQAVVVEVYALQALLVAGCLAAVVHSLSDDPPTPSHWPLVGFMLGLALANHLTGMLLIPGVLIFFLLGLRGRAPAACPPPLPLWATLGATLLPLLLYLYLPVRSRLSPPVNWGHPDTLHRFLVHVSGRQYHGRLGGGGLRLEEMERFLFQQLPGEATWVLPILASVGMAALWWRAWRVGLVTTVVAVGLLIYNTIYPIHDIHLYYVPVLVLFGVWAAVGAGVVTWLASRLRRVAGPGVAGLLCLTFLFPLAAHWEDNDQHDFELLAHFVRDTLRYVDRDAFLFSRRWDTFCAPALYYQVVEGVRPDVVVLDLNLVGNPTLDLRLGERAPDIVEACRREMAAVAEMGRRAERGQSYDVADARRRYAVLARRLVEAALERRPTYATSDLFRHPVFRGIHLISEGLVARLAWKDSFRELPPLRFAGPRITRATARDVRESNILAEYSLMLRNRAAYIRLHDRGPEAAELEKRAALLER
jgi:hypothetical protein